MPYHEDGPVLGRFDMRYLPMCFVVILIVSCCAAAQESRPAELVRINVAEGIIEPFWDPEISTFDEWAVEGGQAHGLRVFQNWAAVDFSWADPPESGPALRMERSYPISCAGYDTLLVRLAAPEGTKVHVVATTELGPRDLTTDAPVAGPYEYALLLDGAETLERLVVELSANAPGPAAGWFEWIGVQKSSLLELYAQRWDYSALRWDRRDP